MDNPLYSYSLCITIPLMLFFSIYFWFGRTPDKVIFSIYRKSRRLMSIAILLLTANYLAHYILKLRFVDPVAAILMNLTTYFLCYWVFTAALNTLINRFYISTRRFIIHVIIWVAYSSVAVLTRIYITDEAMLRVALISLAIGLMAYGLFLSYRLLSIYRLAVKMFDEMAADDFAMYIKWMSHFTYYVLVYGIGCSALTFLPEEYCYLWILSSLPLYIYIFCCYQNYLLFYEQVETVILDESANSTDENTLFTTEPKSESKAEPELVEPEPAEPEPVEEEEDDELIAAQCHFDEIADGIEIWIAAKGFLQSGLTIKRLADKLHTNRTYLSKYINCTYKTTFRNWISDMRIEHAKECMAVSSERILTEISEKSGFTSLSHFTKTFKDKEGISPAKWQKNPNNVAENKQPS